MTHKSFQSAFEDWERRAAFLNQQLAPIINVEIDMNAPDWEEQIFNRPHPVDEAGLRGAVETLFKEIVDQFEFYTPDQRQHIIDLMYKNDALIYSAVLKADPNTPDGLRKHMILFVIDDQGKDTRDALLALSAYHASGTAKGIDVISIFQEMADIASRRDKFGWGTTRDLFLKYLERDS
ncbi:MAG: hypothetical protein ABJN69_07985 [Hellea sp.]